MIGTCSWFPHPIIVEGLALGLGLTPQFSRHSIIRARVTLHLTYYLASAIYYLVRMRYGKSHMCASNLCVRDERKNNPSEAISCCLSIYFLNYWCQCHPTSKQNVFPLCNHLCMWSLNFFLPPASALNSHLMHFYTELAVEDNNQPLSLWVHTLPGTIWITVHTSSILSYWCISDTVASLGMLWFVFNTPHFEQNSGEL